MDLIIKNVPDSLVKFNTIDFSSIDKLLYSYLDFRELEDKDVSQSMVNSINDMDEEIKERGYKNFTSLSS